MTCPESPTEPCGCEVDAWRDARMDEVPSPSSRVFRVGQVVRVDLQGRGSVVGTVVEIWLPVPGTTTYGRVESVNADTLDPRSLSVEMRIDPGQGPCYVVWPWAGDRVWTMEDGR